MQDTVEMQSGSGAVVRTVRRLLEPADPVLSWMIFASVNLLTFVLLWFYGLAQKALASDTTHITLFITLIYLATSLHCLWRCLAISREASAEQRLAASIVDSDQTLGRLVSNAAGDGENDGLVAAHVRSLATKSKLLGDEQKFDQTLLLRVLAERLSGSNPFGAFASDLVMKLGLFGTIVGFIMMLAPIAGLNAEDQGAIKSSMSLMSVGMAVAMYTTLAGLVGSILLRIQYQFVEAATARLFTSAVALTEVHVVPVLVRRTGAAR
jgi:MotA/TolQ/ExbB proton channel family protein